MAAAGSFLPSVTLMLGLLAAFGEAATDPSDAQALWVLYSSLNSPPQLTGWKPNGLDPCGESWKGISCSGSAVTSIQISGLGLNGTLGYLLSNLFSLRTMDISKNNIHDTLPYQLPPNLTYLDIANNNFTGNLPYSISTMVSLNYLNTSHNFLSQSIGDFFASLKDLSLLDLSFNNLSGDLPSSIGLLSNLSSLYLQDNQLTGSVNILENLDLTDLNIANNHFTGWIPQGFRSIPNLVTRGNSFTTSPAPPPPPYTAPPPRGSHITHNRSIPLPNEPNGNGSPNPHVYRNHDNKSLKAGAITGIIIGTLVGGICAALAIICCIWSIGMKKNDKGNNVMEPAGLISIFTDRAFNKEIHEQPISPSVTTLKRENAPTGKVMTDKACEKNGSMKGPRIPLTATSYTVASLQSATNSFSKEFLVGEGSLGRVYKAEFPNGKVLAVKKIDSVALSLQEEDNFPAVVSNMSRLRHPNITALLGYCMEHGQRLLVYEFIGNGTLHDILHFGDDSGKILNWNARVRIALGTARALEYLHEISLPSVVHRNLKSVNILLDEELNPHLSDCGLAALTSHTERQGSTQMVGSFGYSAPEFAMSGIYTVKSDVYSFGVVMLELLTGRKPLDSSRIRSEQSLVRWATPQLHDIDALAKMVDPALKGIYPAKSLSRFADIIALCVQPEPEFRPPMSEVVQLLVRLMQRASIVRRRSGDDLGYSYRITEHEEAADLPL